MTMTSVAVGPASLAAPNMLGPKRYHLQPAPSSSQPAQPKGYETLSKGKKSWSVRLGLSRASQSSAGLLEPSPPRHHFGAAAGWGTVSGGSLLAQQMIYGEPWLYGTVRAARQPVLLVCSCPDFLAGSGRDLGSNCGQCGGHRLAGVALGGTCRMPGGNGGGCRARPSLAGMLRPGPPEDPYDPMRRGSRLLEPQRSRARSISPLQRQVAGLPRDSARSQSLARPQIQAKAAEHAPDQAAKEDARKSILECDVNPYLLLRQRSSDELSDDLSDNALEREAQREAKKKQQQQPPNSSSQLFDPSKVKSIERIPKRSSVAAIGGQRIRLFNEPREPSDEDDEATVAGQRELATLTRIPIPKISPKRPPRRLKEARNALKSILKRADKSLFAAESKRKSVLFNVDNVILAPEKPQDVRASQRKPISKPILPEPPVSEAPIVPEEVAIERPRFITIPNIKSYKQRAAQERSSHQQPPEARIVPRLKSPPAVEKIKIDKFPVESSVDTGKPLVSSESGLVEEPEKVEAEAPPEKAETEATEPMSAKAIVVDEKDMIDKCEGTNPKPQPPLPPPPPPSATGSTTCLTRSQSERSATRPEISAADVSFVDTMRLSLCRRAKDEDHHHQHQRPAAGATVSDDDQTLRTSFPEVRRRAPAKLLEKPNAMMSAPIAEEEVESREIKATSEAGIINKPETNVAEEHFRRMRPTSWSPPPHNAKSVQQQNQRHSQPPASNVFKITVSPKSAAAAVEAAAEAEAASLMVHRLQVRSSIPVKGSRSTVMINAEQQKEAGSESDNKVTISVGGKDSVSNSTVISINGTAPESPRKVSSSGDQKRTLVILDNYRSNIVIGGEQQERKIQDVNANEMKSCAAQSKPIEIKPTLKFKEVESPECSPRWKQIVDPPKSSETSKEELISKLLEDSLRKAKENGEILDEGSGEAILKILKHSLLKSSEPETGYFRPSRNLNSSALDSEAINRSIFLEENAYEVIKEPIYEEIPDEPPPLPLSPPPTEDFLKDRIFFGDEYKTSFRELKNGIGPALDSCYYKPLNSSSDQYLECSYLSKGSGDPFKSVSGPSISDKNSLTSKFELLNFIMDSKERTLVGNVAMDQEEVDEEEEEEEEEDEDPERDLEALYEQKETSLGDLSSKSSQISNVSDSSEECNIILANSPETLKTRTVEIERTDSGVGSESSQASSGRGGSAVRRWRSAGTNSLNPLSGASCAAGAIINATANLASAAAKPSDVKHCEDCEQRLEPLVVDGGCVYSPLVCRKCSKKRAERKEIITEIVETEIKYGRDLQIILEEFHRPMLRAGLLTPEQLSAIFLNVEELLEHNQILAEKLKDAVEIAQESGDEDLVRVDLGKIFLESERMLHAFESYCTRQGSASLLLQNLEKEKELLRIFLKVSQMENTVLRRMNLNSFLMVPVQRVTKYPLLLARLLKATPSGKLAMQELKKRLKEAQTNIELHLEHMNAEAKDITSTKLWRRISIIQNGRRSTGEQDMVNIKLRKMAVEVLEWAHEDSRFVLEGRMLVAQPTDNNWRRGRTVKLAPVTAMLVTNGKASSELVDFSDDSLFPRQIGIKEATLLLVKEKLGRYSLLREPLYLDKCIVCCETDLEDYFEIQELSSKETFIFKAEDGARTKRWCRTLQAHAQSLGAWRRRRGALPNIMICGVARN